MKRVMVYLTDEEYERLRKVSFDERVSMSKLLRECLRREINNFIKGVVS